MELEDDPRFVRALADLDGGDYLEASDGFEELFFEAVRDEVPLVRALLQIATGMHHVSRKQKRPAIERLEEGLRALATVTSARGVELSRYEALAKETIARLSR